MSNVQLAQKLEPLRVAVVMACRSEHLIPTIAYQLELELAKIPA
jgi:hypothetical protein